MQGYMKNEQVRDVVGYEGLYGVSNKGNVYSLRSGCLIEGQKGAYVTLSKDGKGKSWRIGDLVAMAWIRNVGGLRFVRHKDGDIRHNVVRNLEWCNEKEKPRRSDARTFVYQRWILIKCSKCRFHFQHTTTSDMVFYNITNFNSTTFVCIL